MVRELTRWKHHVVRPSRRRFYAHASRAESRHAPTRLTGIASLVLRGRRWRAANTGLVIVFRKISARAGLRANDSKPAMG